MSINDENCSAKVSLRFSNPYYNNIVRGNTESIARKAGFDEDQVYETVMAVDEAYTNAVEHSKTLDFELSLEIEYLIFNDRLEIIVKDKGRGFNISENSIKPVLGNDLSDRGRGLSLIKCLSDKFEIKTKQGIGTEVKIIKYLKNPQEISI